MGPALRLPLCGLIAAAPLWAAAWCEPPRQLQRIAADDFTNGLAHWRLEAEDPRAVVTAQGGMLDIATPAGLSLWWREPLSGDYAIRFTAQALPAPATAGAHAGRLSDLNMFWNAEEPGGGVPRPRSGAFSSYDSLATYYVGFGANGNATTRLRLYDGHERRLLAGFADEPLREPGEVSMNAATRLPPGRALRIEIVSRQPTADDPVHLRWQVDGHTLFTRSDARPRLHGAFVLRTTASRLQVRDFEILQCR